MIVNEVKEATPAQLGNLADVYVDGEAGGRFLVRVRDAVVEAWEGGSLGSDAEYPEDAVSEMADSAVPIYTSDVWQVFVELRAWSEDVEEFGPITDMEQGAKIALYTIAERLGSALRDALVKDAEDNDDGEEEGED